MPGNDRTVDPRCVESMSLREAAKWYIDNGFAIVPLEERSKATHESGWTGEEFISTVAYWYNRPNRNIGLLLGKNHILSLDIDNGDAFAKSMEAIWPRLSKESKTDVPFWKSNTIGISSGRPGRAKLLFMEPELQTSFNDHALNWVDTNKENKSGKACVFELRCGGHQDVVPPSIHPDTQKPYKWVVAPLNESKIIEIPKDLLYLWVYWDSFVDDMMKADPNYVAPAPKKVYHKKISYKDRFTDIADAWSMKRNLAADLTSYDYTIVPGSKRLLYDFSHTGAAGVSILEGIPEKFISYHAGDFFFCGGGRGQKKRVFSAFDLMCHYEYNDNKAEAIRAAKIDLGME